MTKIILGPEHNDTVECFKRHSKVFFSDQFLSEPSPEARWRRKATWYLMAYLLALCLFIWLFPIPPATATAPPTHVPHKQLLPNFQVHLKAMKACAQGSMPVWVDKTTIQCLKEIP